MDGYKARTYEEALSVSRALRGLTPLRPLESPDQKENRLKLEAMEILKRYEAQAKLPAAETWPKASPYLEHLLNPLQASKTEGGLLRRLIGKIQTEA